MLCVRWAAVMAVLACWGSNSFAKGTDTEFAVSTRFESTVTKSGDGNLNHAGIDTSFSLLKDLKSYWLGGEAIYSSERDEDTDFTAISFGALVKYWFKGPDSKGVSSYVLGGLGLGRETNAGSSRNILGLKVAPGVAWFVNDNVAFDGRFKMEIATGGGITRTSTAILVGFSLFF